MTDDSELKHQAHQYRLQQAMELLTTILRKKEDGKWYCYQETEEGVFVEVPYDGPPPDED